MGKRSFWALITAGALLPIVIIVSLALLPASRKAITSFFKPLPTASHATASHDAGRLSLPPVGGVRGAESVELRMLREDASARSSDADRPLRRRTALFGLDSAAEMAKSGERVTRLSGLHRPDIILREDVTIDRALLHLTTDVHARESFVDAWKRSGRFATDLTRIMSAWKVPESLLAVALVESGFQPSASNDAAVGSWQLTPDIAHVYGLSMLPTYDERRGIASSTEVAAHYLADLRERFGSWELALAAYAMGYKPTLDALAKHDSSDFWEIASSLPREAVIYVAEVMATATLVANLGHFRLDTVKRAEAATLSDLGVPAGTALPLVARAASIPPDTLRELNPEYSGDVVPETNFPMVIHVPSDTLARARERLPLLQEGKEPAGERGGESAADASAPPVISRGSDKRMFYRVREGDTLPALSRTYGVSVESIASDNALDATASLQAGMILAIRVPREEADAGSSNPSPSKH